MGRPSCQLRAGIGGQFLGVRSVFLLSVSVIGLGAVAVVLFRRGEPETPLHAVSPTMTVAVTE